MGNGPAGMASASAVLGSFLGTAGLRPAALSRVHDVLADEGGDNTDLCGAFGPTEISGLLPFGASRDMWVALPRTVNSRAHNASTARQLKCYRPVTVDRA